MTELVVIGDKNYICCPKCGDKWGEMTLKNPEFISDEPWKTFYFECGTRLEMYFSFFGGEVHEKIEEERGCLRRQLSQSRK